MKGIRLTSFTRDLVIVYWKRKGVNLLEDFKIDLRYLQLVRKSDEHNLILKDPSDESPDLPLHATMMGFYNDELFLSMDNLILGMSYYRKRTESDPLPIVKSKYPYTNTLRNYLNESHGTLELPPHYHYDDHFLKYGERTYTFRVKQNVWRNDYGTSLDRNESFKIFPLIIDFNFMHFGIKMEMHLIHKYNSDLADDYGNLIARVLHLIDSKNIEVVGPDKNTKAVVDILINNVKFHWQKFEINTAINETNVLIKMGNKYINDERPWEKDKKPVQILSNLYYILCETNKLYSPVLSTETFSLIEEALKNKKKVIAFKKIEL